MVSKYETIDIPKINNLGNKLNPDFSKLFHIDNLNSNEEILIYKEDEKIIGFIHYQINYEIADILNIFVEKSYRNCGKASILLESMIKNLTPKVTKIMLEVNSNNIEAIKFYQKKNFKEIHRRKNYYKDGDGIIMEMYIWKKMFTY